MAYQQEELVTSFSHDPLPNSNDENKEEEEDNDLPEPTLGDLQFVEKKNTEPSSQNTNYYGQSRLIGILQQRLDLANKIKKKAVDDGIKLRKEIEKQDKQLSELRELQNKLEKIKSNYEKLSKDNKELREQIIEINHLI